MFKEGRGESWTALRKLRRRIAEFCVGKEITKTQITSHRACGLGKQKSEACFAFWRLQDHRKGHPTFAFQISVEQKGRRADPGDSQSQEKSAQENPRVSADSAADGGQ